MTLQELKIELQEKYKNLTQQDWLDKIKYRGIEHKFDKQLEEARDFYSEEITRILEILKNPLEFTAEDKQHCLGKIDRLKDKFAAVIKEIEFRKLEIVKRKPVGTTYYIDFVNGLDTNNGLGTETAWKTLSKYTSVTIRSAGDIGKVRANQTHTFTAVVNFDENGNVNNFIILKGCNIADDPWGDASDVRPIMDFAASTAYYFNKNKKYWKIQNLDFYRSNFANGSLYIYNGYVLIENCIFRGSLAYGLHITAADKVLVKDCSISTVSNYNCGCFSSEARFENCTFDGGSYGLYESLGGLIQLIDCSFGVTSNHSVADLYLNTPAIVYARNCIFASPTEITGYGLRSYNVFSEDHDQVKGANKSVSKLGTVEKDTGVVRGGGADSSAKVSPTAQVGSDTPLILTDDFCSGDFRIWCPASATTITIYIRGFGWAAFPTASELFIEAEYLPASGAIRSKSTASTQVLSDNTTWVAFITTFTPGQAGWAYVKVYLKKYTASCGIYVDIKPIVS